MASNKMDFNLNVKTTADLAGIQKVSGELDKLKAKANEMNMPGVVSSANQVQNALAKAFNPKINMVDINKFNSLLAASNSSLGQVAADFNRMGTQGRQAYIGLINQSLQMGTAIKTTNSALDKMATTFKNTIRYSISSLTFQKITGEIQATIGYVKDLDKALNNIQIVSGQNADQMARFAKEANAAAQALGTTTKSYAEAALIFYQQGLDSNEVKQRTDVTMQMANVTGDSADEVSSYMTAIWNNFEDGSQSLEHYADVITALGASTASSSAEIAEGLEKFAAIGDTVGLSYEYATSALATVVATTRQSADTVGTAFKTLFARIQDLELGKTLDDGTDLGKYSQALATIGVNIKNANGEVKDMDTILNEMGSKWGSISKDTQIAVAQAVAGTRQYTQLVALMENWEFFQQNVNTAQQSSGELAKQQAIYMDSVVAKEKEAAAAAEALKSSFLSADNLKSGYSALTDFYKMLTSISDAVGGLKGTFFALGGVLLNVFSKHIATDLGNFVINVKNAYEQVSQFNEIQGQLKNGMFFDTSGIGDADKNDPGFQKMEAAQKRLVAGYQELTQSKQAFTEVDWAKTNELINEQSEIEALKIKLSDLHAESQFDIIIEDNGSLQTTIKNIEDLKKNINELKNGKAVDIAEVILSSDSFLGANSSAEKTKAIIQEVHEYLGLSAEQTQELERRLGAVASSSADTKEVFVNWLQTLEIDEEQLNDIIKKLDEINQKQSNFDANKEGFISDKSIQATIQGLTKITAAISSVVMLMNQASAISEIMWNPAISSTEKTTQVLKKLAGALPSLIFGVQAVTTALTGMGIALKVAFPIAGALIAVLLGGYTAWDIFANSAKHAAEAMNQAVESYTEAENKIASLNDELKTTEDRINELRAKGPLTITEQEELIKLQQERQELEQQLEIEKEIAALKGQEVIETYKKANDKGQYDYDSKYGIGYTEASEAYRNNHNVSEDQLNTRGSQERNNYLNALVSAVGDVSGKIASEEIEFEGTTVAVKDLLQDIADIGGEEALKKVQGYENYEKRERSYYLKSNKEDQLKNDLKDGTVLQDIENLKATIRLGTDSVTGALDETAQNAQNQLLKIYRDTGRLNSQIQSAQDAAFKDDNELKDFKNNANISDKLKKNEEITKEDIQQAVGDEERGNEIWNSLTASSKAYGLSIEQIISNIKLLNGTLSQTKKQEPLEQVSDVTTISQNYDKAVKAMKKVKDGATLTADEFNALGDAAEDFFVTNADGTHRFIGNLQEFKTAMSDSINSTYLANANRLDEEVNRLQELQEKAQNGGLEKVYSAGTVNSGNEVAKNYVQDQINLLKETGGADVSQLKNWQDMLDNGTFNPEDLVDIANAIKEVGDAYDILQQKIDANQQLSKQEKQIWANSQTSINDLRNALQQGTIDEEQFGKALESVSIAEAQANGLDIEQFKAYRDILLSQNEVYKDNLDGLNEVTIANMRLDKGVAALSKDWKNVDKIMSDSNSTIEDVSSLLPDVNKSLKDILNLDTAEFELLPPDFAKKNWNLIQDVMNGVEGAVDTLRDKAGEEILLNVSGTVDADGKLRQELSNLNTEIASYDQTHEIEVGIAINDEGFLESCNEIVSQAGMSAAQAQAYFKSLGYDVEIEEVESPVQTTKWRMENPHIDEKMSELTGIPIASGTDVLEGTNISGGGKAIAVKSITPNGSNGGGVGVKKTNTGGGGNKSKGGGGGKSSKKDKKDKKRYDDEFDRYWQIKKNIDAINNSISDLEKKQSKTFGKELINNLKQVNSQLEKQKKNYDDLIKEQKKEQGELQKTLKDSKYNGVKIEFDTKGGIKNYKKITDAALKEYNAALDKYNNSKQTDKDKEALEKAEKKYEDFKKNLERYETLYYDEMRDATEKAEDLIQQMIENNLKAWEVNIQISLDLSEAKRQWADFLKSANTKFGARFQNLLLEGNTIQAKADTYAQFDNKGQLIGGDLRTDQDALRDALLEKASFQNGTHDNFKDPKFSTESEADERIKELEKKLQEDYDSYNSLINELYQLQIEGINQLSERIEDVMNQYEDIDSELEHQKELINLLYGEESFDLMDQFYDAQKKNNLSRIASLQDEAKTWEAIANDEKYSEEARYQAKEKLRETEDKIRQSIEDQVNIIKDDYLNAVKKLTTEIANGVTGGTDFDVAKQSWEQMKEDADAYYDSTNRIYHTQTLLNKIETSKNSQTNLKNQQKLQKLYDTELNYLREKEKLNEYDIEMATLRYEIALKEIALEDARENRNQMKLARNAQGNWTYQYVADQEAIDKAQQEALDKQHEYTEKAKEEQRKTIDEAYSLTEKMQSDVAEIFSNTNMYHTDDERNKAYEEYMNRYATRMNDIYDRMSLAAQDAGYSSLEELRKAYQADSTIYEKLTKEQKNALDYVLKYGIKDYASLGEAAKDSLSGISGLASNLYDGMTGNWTSMTKTMIEAWQGKDGNSGVKDAVTKSIENFRNLLSGMKNDMSTLASQTNRNFGSDGISGAISGAANAVDELNGQINTLANNALGENGWLTKIAQMASQNEQNWKNATNAALEYLRVTGNGGGSTVSTASRVQEAAQVLDPQPQKPQAPIAWSYNVMDPMTGKILAQGTTQSWGVIESLKSRYTDAAKQNLLTITKMDGTKKQVSLKPGTSLSQFKTGGYTGDWAGEDGKLAMLHQKELVLNAADTENILTAVKLVRTLTDTVNEGILSQINSISNIGADLIKGLVAAKAGSEQPETGDTYNITAEFPHANNVQEIQQAILSLPGLAAQYTKRNKR